MGHFYIQEGDYLVSSGHCADGAEPNVIPPQVLVQGIPALPASAPPSSGYKWNLLTKQWDDVRSEQEKRAAAVFEVAAARHAEYPPLTDLADALVHQSLGNPAPLDSYLARCVAVKERFPKLVSDEIK